MTVFTRRELLLAASSVALSGAARAQGGWPQRPITMIVPFPAGGGTDVTARATARILSEALGQQVIVENKGGAAGAIGTEQGARAAADGYTLVFGTTGTHTVNQTLYPKLGYDPVSSFEPISLVCRYNNVLVTHPSFPAHDMAGLLREVRANPGKYFYAISVNGSSGHLAMELLKADAKLQIQGVPYKGASEAMNDFMSGRVPLFCDTVINQLQNIRAGKVKAIATTGPQRSPALPEVPTVAEAAGMPGWQAVGWAGVFAPAGTPRPIVDRLSAELRKSVNSPYYAGLAKSGLELVATTPEETRAFVISETEKWRKLIRAAGIGVA
jgi:tripartite-type tricarboxylate transporter receptor subunit TctC